MPYLVVGKELMRGNDARLMQLEACVFIDRPVSYAEPLTYIVSPEKRRIEDGIASHIKTAGRRSWRGVDREA